MDIIENLIDASYSLPAKGTWTDPPNNVCTQAAREIERLRNLLAAERGCSECWRGAACGSDCHMADVAALAAGEGVMDSRAAFEAWAKSKSILLDRDPLKPDEYETNQAHDSWIAWQARDAEVERLTQRAQMWADEAAKRSAEVEALRDLAHARAINSTPPITRSAMRKESTLASAPRTKR